MYLAVAMTLSIHPPRTWLLLLIGGDPGSRPPKELLQVGELFNADLKRTFPNSTLWMGPQEWSPTELEDWNAAIKTVSWLDG